MTSSNVVYNYNKIDIFSKKIRTARAAVPEAEELSSVDASVQLRLARKYVTADDKRGGANAIIRPAPSLG